VQIGYVGLGNMGGALAARLQLSHPLVVFDMSDVATAAIAKKGARVAPDLRELGSSCDIVFLCLPTSNHVSSVIFGDRGLAGAMKPGTVIVDQTTGDPNVTRALASELASKDIGLVDAPVSGGRFGAEAGTIAIMVGAEQKQFERIAPILNAISPNVFHAGGVGNGHVIKLVNNLLSTAQRLLSFEAISLAAKNGVEPATALDILLAGGGKNAYLEKMMKPRILAGKLNVGFTLGLAHKDVRLACELGADSKVPTFFGDLTQELYQKCIDEFGTDSQVDTVGLFFDRMGQTQVVPAKNDLN
jgi:3-hydroxyisobutyrate dehydrogenase